MHLLLHAACAFSAPSRAHADPNRPSKLWPGTPFALPPVASTQFPGWTAFVAGCGGRCHTGLGTQTPADSVRERREAVRAGAAVSVPTAPAPESNHLAHQYTATRWLDTWRRRQRSGIVHRENYLSMVQIRAPAVQD